MHIINRVLRPLNLRISRANAVRSRSGKIVTLDRNTKETLNGLWDDEEFKRQYRNSHQNLYESLMAIVQSEGLLKQVESLIDVGCGPGYFLELLNHRGFAGALHGCDFAESAVQTAAKSCARAEVFVHDVYQPLTKHFDLLFCMETLEHLLHPGLALQHLLDASKVTVLTVPEGRKDSFQGHINFWSPESWEVWCRDHASGRTVTTRPFNETKNLIAIFR